MYDERIQTKECGKCIEERRLGNYDWKKKYYYVVEEMNLDKSL